MGDLDRLGDLLPPEASGRTPVPTSGEDSAYRLAAVWAQEMGPEVAANAKPVQLRDSRLVVTTSSSAWAQTLQLMSPMVAERLNQRLGEGTVEKVVFRHAGWDPSWSVSEAEVSKAEIGDPATPDAEDAASPAVEPPAGGETSQGAGASEETVTLSPDEQRALDEVDRLPLPPEVRSTIRRAMIADFVRDRQDSGRS